MGLLSFFSKKSEKLELNDIELGLKNDKLALPDLIIDYAFKSVELLMSTPANIIKNKEIDDIDIARYEFTMFYIHFTHRTIAGRFGKQKADEIMPDVILETESKFAEIALESIRTNGYQVPENVRELMRKNFNYIYNNAISKYSECSSIFDEKSSAAGRMIGENATALVTCLTDNINMALNGEKVATDLLFINIIKELIYNTLQEKKIDRIIEGL